MSFKSAEAAVQGYFDDGWKTGSLPLTPIAWPDRQFTPPNGTWVRFSMKNTIGQQASIGSPNSNYFRRQGIVTIQIFAKENGGALDCRTKADVAVSLFMANGLSGFTFSNVNASGIGADGHGWYQWNVTAEYQYDITA